MNNNTTITHYLRIPVNITGSLQSTYIYAKLRKAINTWYSESTLGKNPITKKQELRQGSISKYVNELNDLGFITITKEKVENKDYTKNIYVINEMTSDFWIAVHNDFINLPDIPAEIKGFAIRLACLQNFPKTITEVCDVIGINYRTCKKYIDFLEGRDILHGQQLNEEYFPDLRKEKYKNEMNVLIKDIRKCDGNKSMQKKLDWLLQNITPDKFPYKFICEKLKQIQSGYWDRQEVRKEIKHLYNITL